MAAKAARPATAIEPPTVLAAPLKAMGEPVADGGLTLECLLDAEVLWVGRLEMTYAPVEAAAVPVGAAAPAAPPAGTLTGEPGLGGSLPDGEADPDAPDSPLDGEPEPELAEPEEPDSPLDGEPEPELEEPVEPAAAGVGVAVTVE